MSAEYDPQFRSLQIWTCIPKLIVKTKVQQEVNFEFASQMFVWHVDLSLANSQATIFRFSVGDCVWNPSIQPIEVIQRYTVAAPEQPIFVTAWCTL